MEESSQRQYIFNCGHAQNAMVTGTRVPAGNRDSDTRVQNLYLPQPYAVLRVKVKKREKKKRKKKEKKKEKEKRKKKYITTDFSAINYL